MGDSTHLQNEFSTINSPSRQVGSPSVFGNLKTLSLRSSRHTSNNHHSVKTILRFLFAGLLSASGLAQAKVITVDNNPGSVAMYSSLQTAIDSAATGDTILIAGSPFSYGSVQVGRRLKFAGAGYFLGEHSVPGINKNTAMADFSLNRVNLFNASGCTFSSLSGTVNLNHPGITGVSIDKCFLTTNFTENGYGAVSVSRSWINGSCYFYSNGSTVRNSIIGGSIVLRNGATVTNCVIRDFNSTSHIDTSAGSSISNTIFITSTAVSLTKSAFAARCLGSISHCLAVSGPGPSGGPGFLPDGLGNNPTIHLFYDVFTGGDQDKAFYLIDDCPAKGTGFGGVDMGVFAGPSPYVIAGLPQIPRITRFVIPSKATSTSGLRIEMDAQAF